MRREDIPRARKDQAHPENGWEPIAKERAGGWHGKRFATLCHKASRFLIPFAKWRILGQLSRVLKLGVNIDHIATLREARYRGRSQGEPDVIQAAQTCQRAG